MGEIKIGYFADGPWSHRAFEKIIEDTQVKILFIVPRTNTKDFTLKKYAHKYNIDYLESVRINSDDFIEKVKAYNCDLFVSMSFNQIFKKEIIDIPKLGVINCHAGKLPFYRGRNILNWVLINDEKEYGITVHYIDEGIDTGNIILQRTFPISDSDNYKTLLERSYIECAKLLYDSIKKIMKGNIQTIKQTDIHPVGFYCGRRTEGDEIINWNNNTRSLFNFIRAICYPGPQATTCFKGYEVKINNAEIIKKAPNYIGTPGQVLLKAKNEMIVKTKDSFIKIKDYTCDINIKIGDKLGV